jgi:hypothetical protein
MQKENKNPEYVIYMGKSVLKEFFRTYVYAKEGDEKKLANSWKEYKELINSGEWVDEKKAEIIEIKPKLKKN